MNKIYLVCLLIFLIGSVHAQDTLRRSASPLGGAWQTKSSLTNFVSVGQPGVNSLMSSEDGVWTGSVGFISRETIIGRNNAPVAFGSEFPVFVSDSLVELQGFDPDNDPISFEVLVAPTLGTLEPIGGGLFQFLPATGLNPGQLYNDQVTFKVNDGSLDSEEAVLQIQFILEDVPHQISGLSFSESVLSLTWSDNVPNDNYQVEIEYYDLSDAANPIFRLLTDQEVLAADVIVADTEFALDLAVAETTDPYLFNGDQVLVATSVVTPNGVGSFEVFIIDNTTGARVTTSDDGQFFAFGGAQTVRENGTVELSLYGVELGDFDISSSIIEILNDGEKGTLENPLDKETGEYIKEWTATYTSVEEVGGLDSIQFRVFNQDRQMFDTAWVMIDIVDVNDPPKLESIASQVTQEDTPLQVTIDAIDPDNEIEVLVQSSESTLVPASYTDGVITIDPTDDYFGVVSISVIVTEVGTDEEYVAFRRFNVEVLDVDDLPVVAAIPDATIDEDNTITFIATASDVDAPLSVFNFRVEVSDPSAFEVSVNGGTITLSPIANINGTFGVKVFADDGQGKATSVSLAEEFTLVVNPVNDAPEVIRSFATQQIVADLPDYTINLGAYFTDVENGTDLTYSFAGNTEIVLTETNGILTVSPGDNFNSIEEVTVTASDGELEVSQQITFAFVQASADIVVAVPIDNIIKDEDAAQFTLDVNATFVDQNDANAVFEYTISGGGFIDATIDELGVITFVLEEDYFGTETFFLFASTGGQASFTSFDVQVNAVNDAPVITRVDAREVSEDQTLTGVFIPVEDVDNVLEDITLLFSSSDESIIRATTIESQQLGNGFSLNVTPEPNANGAAEITIIASDGVTDDEMMLTVNVLAVNDDPEVTSTSVANATEDVSYSLDLTTVFTDIDQDALTFALNEKPAWLSLANSLVQGTPSNDDVGNATVQVRADDGNGGITIGSFEIVVDNVNDAPTLISQLPDLSLLEDVGTVEITLSTVFEDVDGDELVYVVSSSNVEVITASSANGLLTLTEVSNGISTISINVDDQNGGVLDVSFDVVINNVNDAPVVVSGLDNQLLEEGFTTLTIDLSASFSYED